MAQRSRCQLTLQRAAVLLAPPASLLLLFLLAVPAWQRTTGRHQTRDTSSPTTTNVVHRFLLSTEKKKRPLRGGTRTTTMKRLMGKRTPKKERRVGLAKLRLRLRTSLRRNQRGGRGERSAEGSRRGVEEVVRHRRRTNKQKTLAILWTFLIWRRKQLLTPRIHLRLPMPHALVH